MPIPTCASKIIPTSLPPSPTAAVLLPVYCIIFLTIRAFWVGLHLHTHTLGASVAVEKNFSSRLLVERIMSKLYPSIISMSFSAFWANFANISSTCFQLCISLMKNNCWFLLLKPALIAMQVAVSTLSPVSIHIWMPALRRLSMVSATSSWSLSISEC